MLIKEGSCWQQMLYDPKEMWQLQDFDAEHHLQKNDVANFAQWGRLFCMLLVAPCYWTAFLYWPKTEFLIPFTNWTLLVTTFSLVSSYSAANNKDVFKKWVSFKDEETQLKSFKLQANHHMLYTLSIMMNLITVSVYWTILPERALAKFSPMPIVGPGRTVHLYIVHIFPGVSCVINSY